MFRRRQQQQNQSDENSRPNIDSDPVDRRKKSSSLNKKYFYPLYACLSIDLILTLTRQTWPLFISSLPLMQRLLHTPGKDGTYAQNYQDTWIVKLAESNANFYSMSPGPLFFLDIGAYHGLWCSNSYLIEKQFGWRGACVEPFPDGFEQRSCQLFVNAMSDTDGIVVSFNGAGQERNIGAPKSSSTRKGGLTAETLSFPTLLKKSKAPSFIAFISLDVEGHEYAALSKFPWDEYKVGGWIVEGHSNEVKKLLEDNGYKQRPVQNRGADEYYVSDEYWTDDMAYKEWRYHPLFSWGC